MVSSVSTVLLNSFGGRLLPTTKSRRPAAERITVKVPSMHCQGCAGNLKAAVGQLPSVVSVDADPRTKRVTVAVRDGRIGREEICAAITAIGHVCGEES